MHHICVPGSVHHTYADFISEYIKRQYSKRAKRVHNFITLINIRHEGLKRSPDSPAADTTRAHNKDKARPIPARYSQLARHGAHPLAPAAGAAPPPPVRRHRHRHGDRGSIRRASFADAVAGAVPRGAVHEPDQLLGGLHGPAASHHGPLLRLAAAAQPQPGPPPALRRPALRRGVEQRHLLLLRLLHLPRPALPRRRAPALVALGRRRRVPGPTGHRRHRLPRLGQGRLHLLLRGGRHGPPRPLGLRRRDGDQAVRDELRARRGTGGRRAVAGAGALLPGRRQRWRRRRARECQWRCRKQNRGGGCGWACSGQQATQEACRSCSNILIVF